MNSGLILTAIISLFSSSVLGQAHDEERIYRDALDAARSGRTQQALEQLQILRTEHPRTLRYLYDYVQILSWTDQYEKVIELSRSIDLDAAPIYVIESVASSARNSGDFKQSETLYRSVLERFPDRFESKLGLGLTLKQSGDHERAISYLTELSEAFPERLDILIFLAQIHENLNNFSNAANLYRKILAIQPDRADIQRNLAFALQANGQYEDALTTARHYKAAFSDEEWAGFRWDYAAALIRKSAGIPSGEPNRYQEMDKAISAVEANIESIAGLELSEPQIWLDRANFDLMVALRNRNKMPEVIALFERLKEQGIEIPSYSRIAAADAYLYTRQPKRGRDLYLSIIEDSPDNRNARASLIYAYLESEQFKEAIELADRLNEEQPETLEFKDELGHSRVRDNPDKIYPEMTAALMRAYADKLYQGQSRMEDLYRRALYNPDIEAKLADIYYFRGWPRKALRLIEPALERSPDHLGLRVVQTKVLHELRSYPAEEQVIQELYDTFPDDTGVQRQSRLWNIHNGWEFKMFTGGGVSDNQTNDVGNPNIGTEDMSLESYLYSSPIAHHYRVYIHNAWKMGLFPQPEGRGYLNTHGLGLEFAGTNVLATGEVHYDNFAKNAVGVGLGLAYDFDDHWRISTYLDSLNNRISLRALTALADEKVVTTAKSAQARLTYRFHESRQMDLAANYYHFSDGNNRYGVDGAYYERWYSGPFYKFSTYLNAGYSINTRHSGSPDNPNRNVNAYYFNPAQDASVSLTLDNDLLTYRFYETAFNQRLAVSIGQYWQQYFGSNPVGNIQYEHRWKTADRLEVAYGGIRGYHYYDGNLTESWFMYLNLNVRF